MVIRHVLTLVYSANFQLHFQLTSQFYAQNFYTVSDYNQANLAKQNFLHQSSVEYYNRVVFALCVSFSILFMCQNLEIILVFLFPENLILPVKELIVIIMLNRKRRRKFCLVYGLLLRSITLGDGSQGEGGTLTFEECVFILWS